MTLYTTMADAANWERIPAGEVAAVYDDGAYACPQSVRSRWKACVGITVTGSAGSEMSDAEEGNAGPETVVAGAIARVAAGGWKAIYRGHYAGDAYNGESVDRAMAAAGQTYADPALWPAPGIYSWGVDWTGIPHVRPGDLLTQYAGNLPDGTDLSECYGTFPVPPAPTPPPTPAPPVPAPTVVQTVTDKELGAMQTVLVPISLDAQGNGATQTAYPFASLIAVTHQSSDPWTDGTYWYGEAHAQDRNNQILVTVTRCQTREGVMMKETGVYLTLAE